MQEADYSLIRIISSVNIKGVCGIYAFIHRDSGMCYVGKAVDIGRRIGQHFRAARNGSTSYFHRVLMAFGAWSFDLEVLEECIPDQLNERESFYIAFLDATGANGMNTMRNPACGGSFGIEVNEATRARKSMALRGRKKTDDHRAAMSAGRKGIKLSEEHRKNIGAAVRGRKLTAEHVEKVRQSHIGKKRSQEACRNMSASQKKNPVAQLDKTTGMVIAVFESCRAAAIATGICYPCIKDAYAGKLKTSGGFRWIPYTPHPALTSISEQRNASAIPGTVQE